MLNLVSVSSKDNISSSSSKSKLLRIGGAAKGEYEDGSKLVELHVNSLEEMLLYVVDVDSRYITM